MNTQRVQLWIALVGFAIGAFILHDRIHPPLANLTNFWATLFASADLVLVSILFLFRKTALWALLLNSFLAYLGIIMMTDLTIVSTLEGWIKVSPREQPLAWLIESMFPDIAILVGDLMVGMALYRVIVSPPQKQTTS
ncbi:MAG TPA: hypothetical protein VMC85_11685 [Desulfomonilaceae bacterium]|nr:hypothetical protein [Desulfomonilaceae bacterium]